ncbi:MAG TPA: hypothetical protein VNO33_05785 [Kofleriaceae bacterium]|nr:hypothetical protein [Kofleriaceae bacterium]
MTRSSAPGKILLAGEYAVLEGGAAVVMAVNRRARAWFEPPATPPSPFLAAAARVLAAELGADSPAARAAASLRVDTGALAAESGEKLGLGSSAAATVAGLAVCLGCDGTAVDVALLHRLAHRAHGDAQAALDPAARGSGADVAASVRGGVLLLEPGKTGDAPPVATPLALPPALELVPVWTGQPADTRELVAAVKRLADRDRPAYSACLIPISDAAVALASACRAGAADRAVAAVAAGGLAVRDLGRAAGIELFLDSLQALAEQASELGGALKPTGAGGGDIALAAFTDPRAAQQFRAHAAGAGMPALDLRVDPRGAALEDDSA